MGHSQSQSCISTTTSLPNTNCTNLIEWTFSKFTEIFGKGQDKLLPQESIDRILDKGMVLPKCNFCCPCTSAPYVFASVETYLKYGEAVTPENAERCCNQFNSAIEDYLECHGLNNSQTWDYILDKGIIESNLIQGNSQLPYIFEWINLIISTGQSGNTTATEIFDRILDKGVVVWCNDETGDISIASVETFLKLAEVVNGLDASDVCCTNIYASVETYLKYAEFVGYSDVPA
jgi:hypothetical protein